MMEIPEKLQIAGLEWTVRLVEPDRHELIDGTTVGHIYYDKLLIVVNEKLPSDLLFTTFLHELNHAIFYVMGKTDKEVRLDEDFIDAYSMLLYQVMGQILDCNV